ncbi:unnamed protein product [Boreogadus saida]
MSPAAGRRWCLTAVVPRGGGAPRWWRSGVGAVVAAGDNRGHQSLSPPCRRWCSTAAARQQLSAALLRRPSGGGDAQVARPSSLKREPNQAKPIKSERHD